MHKRTHTRARAQAVDIFLEALGAEAGHAALRALCRGGVYVVGGIAPRLKGRLDEVGHLRDGYLYKVRVCEMFVCVCDVCEMCVCVCVYVCARCVCVCARDVCVCVCVRVCVEVYGFPFAFLRVNTRSHTRTTRAH